MMTSLWMLLYRLDEPLDFFDEVGGGGRMVSTMPLRLFLESAPARRLFLLHLAGRFQVRLAEIAFSRHARAAAAVPAARLRGGRPAAMFSARSISCAWRVSKTLFVAAVSADDFGARLRGFAVGFLRVGMSQPAAWAGSAFRRGGAGKNFCHS